MRPLLALLFLTACTPAQDADQTVEVGDEWVSDTAPDPSLAPPTYVSLTAEPYVMAGMAYSVRVSEAGEGEVVWLAASAEPGEGPCRRFIGGYCLDIAVPTYLIGTGSTDGDGRLAFELEAPPWPGAQFCYQAVIRRGPGGLATALSDVVCVEFCSRDDGDGDGLCDEYDPCFGDDDLDTDGDGVCDDRDTCPGGPDDVDSDDDGVCDTLDVCPGFDDSFDSDADGTPDGCEAGPSIPFEFDYPDAGDTCPDFTDWRAALPTSGLTGVRMYGTFDLVGLSCSDPGVTQALADAIRTNVAYLGFCDGHEWSVCDRYTGEIWIDPPALCSGSNCPSPGYIIRPCIGGGYPVPGAVNSGTCSNIPQMMGIEFY